MLATVLTSLVRGLEGRLVEVRVRSAIRNSGLPFPQRRVTINLAPAPMRKDGSSLDLAIAVGICLPGLLPPLGLDEALEVAQVCSVLGELAPRRPLDWRRPAPRCRTTGRGAWRSSSSQSLPGASS